jgi:hypothetical protein
VAALSVSYTGTNYYTPVEDFSRCTRWTWLTNCYTDPAASETAQQGVSSDAAFIVHNGQGTFQRVWVSLDELMNWDPTTGYHGFNSQYLANLDDALARFHAYGIKVELVLFQWGLHTEDQYQFHPEALDGNHATMRAHYLQAMRDFVSHLAANPTDAATVAVMDLQNEAYYQMKQFFEQGQSYLGTFTQCWTGSVVDRGCVDQNITRPWLTDLYNAAHGAAPNFEYTVSDVGYLLTTTASDQQFWESMYPVDVYDIHVYSPAPWNDAARWATGSLLKRPWFSGESGCVVNDDFSCSYSGNTQCAQPSTCALSVDTWWLNNLKSDGASAVLVEDNGTAWTTPDGPKTQTLTLVGHQIQQVTLNSPAAPLLTSTPTATTSP